MIVRTWQVKMTESSCKDIKKIQVGEIRRDWCYVTFLDPEAQAEIQCTKAELRQFAEQILNFVGEEREQRIKYVICGESGEEEQ